jgi:hypothetical protein
MLNEEVIHAMPKKGHMGNCQVYLPGEGSVIYVLRIGLLGMFTP